MPQKALQPIPTRYAGCHFRSRLEARVAVFLDAMGCSWEYEPQGFDLPLSGRYLPDFMVRGFPLSGESPPAPQRSIDFWLEVKPVDPVMDEVNKLRELACITKTHGLFFAGSRLVRRYASSDLQDVFRWMVSEGRRPLDPWEEHCGKLLCLVCAGMGVFSLSQSPTSRFIPDRPLREDESFSGLRGRAHEDYYTELDELSLTWAFVDVERAAMAAASALSARFEHGESGPT